MFTLTLRRVHVHTLQPNSVLGRHYSPVIQLRIYGDIRYTSMTDKNHLITIPHSDAEELRLGFVWE